MAETVLILGGSYAGLHVAHALLKKNDKDVKVILVSQNDHFYWNMASVRAIVPGIIKDEELFKPLASALERYPSTSYELIIGSVTSSDFDARSVHVNLLPSGESRSISYDQLVLATGSRTPEVEGAPVPWKASGTYEQVLSQLHQTTEQVKAASHIVVAGSGPTGVEVAGELGYEFGKTKKIILLCSDASKILGGDITAPASTNELKKLNVEIKYSAKVLSTRPSGDGKTEIVLANGETLTTDLYLPTYGLVPNSEYISPKYLTEHKHVIVDENLRVVGTENVWAAGDLVSKPRAGFMITQKQAAGVAKNVELVLKGKQPVVAKGMPVDVLAISVGRGRGAGRAGSFRLPSLMVWLAKGRTMALQMVGGYVDGSVA
ncbi:apoptosis-inducing factor B [Rhypophila sp. PSN 637]